MVLLVDIGNSNIVFAFSEKGQVNDSFRLKSFLDKTDDENAKTIFELPISTNKTI